MRNRGSPVRPQKLSKLVARVVGVKEQRRKQLASAGPLPRVGGATKQTVESLIKHDRPFDTDRPVT